MRNENESRLELMLDAALAEYGAVEPLSGLEERVLSRLRSEQERARPWWMWAAVAAAAILVAALLLTQRRTERVVAPPVVRQAPAPVAQPAVPEQPKVAGERPVTRRTPKAALAMAANELPRRDVFPSPMPATEQERLLARYMRVTPRSEVLARIQRETFTLPEDPWAPPATNASPQQNEPMR